MRQAPGTDSHGDGLAAQVKLVLLAILLAAAAFILWRVQDVVLMAFGAVVVATVLLAMAWPVRRWTPLPHGWSVLVSLIVLIAILAGLGVLMWSQAVSQFAALVELIPQSLAELERRLGLTALPDFMQPSKINGGEGTSGTLALDAGLGWLMTLGRNSVSIFFTTLVIVIAGVYLALEPHLYSDGMVRLWPPARREQVRDVLGTCGLALHRWLLGKLLAMAIIGVLAGLGTWWLGLPSPLMLGLIAGLTEFVPIVGPIIGAVPAVILAATEGWTTVLWTVFLYVAIQQVEANVVTPLIQQKMVSIGPAVFMIGVAAAGALFGPLGIILSGPLTVAFSVVSRCIRDKTYDGDEAEDHAR